MPMATQVARQLSVACMKGRSNYLCLRRLKEGAGKSYLLSEDRGRLARLEEWAEGSASGERSEIEWLADDDPFWHQMDARSDICTGQACDD